MAVNGNGNGGADGLYGVAGTAYADFQVIVEGLVAELNQADGDFLPTISIYTEIGADGLISSDTFSIVWFPYSDYALYPTNVSDATFASGEMTIYKEVVSVAESRSEVADYWNLFRSLNTSTGPSFAVDTTNDDTDITVFNISLNTSETSALEAKYSQTDYSIDDVYNALNDPENYSITGSIGTAFSSAISKVITTNRLSTRFIWNKSHQKPFKEPNKTAIGTPTDDE